MRYVFCYNIGGKKRGGGDFFSLETQRYSEYLWWNSGWPWYREQSVYVCYELLHIATKGPDNLRYELS